MDRELWLDIGSEETLQKLIVTAIKHADATLIAAALLIIGIGLYTLFIKRLEHLPPWLDIESLGDLKDKLISVVVVVTAVDFFTNMVEWEGGSDILFLGGRRRSSSFRSPPLVTPAQVKKSKLGLDLKKS